MAKPEWGVKRLCPSCASRFYDLMRDPIICPACGESFGLDVFTKPRRGKAATAKTVAAKPAPVAAAEESEIEDNELEESDDDSIDDDDDVLALAPRRRTTPFPAAPRHPRRHQGP
ncbi:MAG: TIGR02300 family protein, partial [Pseudomonadota bacterium]